MKKDGYFLVFESAPKCGKTTLATHLVKTIQETQKYKTIHKRGALSVSEFSKKISSRNINDIGYSTAFYWADIVFDTIDSILPNLKKSNLIIQERYDLSVVSYRETHGFYDDFLLMDEYIKRGMIVNPDLTVFLKTDPEIVFKRIIEDRESSSVDLSFLNKPHKHLLMQDSIIQHIKRMERKNIIIETDKLNIEESVNFIIQQLKSEKIERR